ncbi:MAG: protein-glutamate O-methyltransferase CheR, partial [candidate division NC10 bacterium]|nr:protein-glutamate O-methyltransferase CheR [candidate division NC10 bacterium]
MRLSNELCIQAQALIASRLGLDFSKGRQADLERGLVGACRTSSVSVPETYLAWLATLPDESTEWRRLVGHLTVGETYFFRDRALFEALEQHVLPSLITARRTERNLRLRLWSAGCATGEEPYSLAVLLDRLLPDLSEWALTILATDINPDALEAARRGCYREWSFRETPQWTRDQYFHRRNAETFEVSPRIRRMVTVAPLNLAEDGYPAVMTNTSAMDLVLCRNVLMYFTRDAQRATVARLQRALVSEGWLAVSPAEASAELFQPLVSVNFPGAILYRKGGDSAVSYQPSAVSEWEIEDRGQVSGDRGQTIVEKSWSLVPDLWTPAPTLPPPSPIPQP